MWWTKEDSDNLRRIANALETIAGTKSFIPNKEKLKIEVVEDNDDEEKEIAEKQSTKISDTLAANEGKHLWEETNLDEVINEEEVF